MSPIRVDSRQNSERKAAETKGWWHWAAALPRHWGRPCVIGGDCHVTGLGTRVISVEIKPKKRNREHAKYSSCVDALDGYWLCPLSFTHYSMDFMFGFPAQGGGPVQAEHLH